MESVGILPSAQGHLLGCSSPIYAIILSHMLVHMAIRHFMGNKILHVCMPLICEGLNYAVFMLSDVIYLCPSTHRFIGYRMVALPTFMALMMCTFMERGRT